MKAETKFWFECRLCKQGFPSVGLNCSDTERMMAVLDVILGVRKEALSPSLLDIHSCGDGNYGVADFIGAKRAVK